MRKIYVTGLGVISGIGKGVEENLDSLKAGKHGMGKITLFPTALDVPVSEVKQSNEELKKLLSLPSGKTYSRTALLGLWAAQEAARDAELDFTSPRIGLISSTSIGGMDASERFYASFREDNRKGRLRDIISHDCGVQYRNDSRLFGSERNGDHPQHRLFFGCKCHYVRGTPDSTRLCWTPSS